MMALLGPGASGEQGSPAVLFGAGFRRRAQVSPARASAVATSPARQSRRRRPRLEPPNGPPDGMWRPSQRCGAACAQAAADTNIAKLHCQLAAWALRPPRCQRRGSGPPPGRSKRAPVGELQTPPAHPGVGGGRAGRRSGEDKGGAGGRMDGGTDRGTEGRRDGGTEGRRDGGKEGRREGGREPQKGRERGRERGPAHAHAHTNGLGRAHKNTGRDGERGERESPLALVRLSVARYENACLRLHARTHAHSAAKSAQTCFNERARTRPPPHPLPSPPREPHVFC